MKKILIVDDLRPFIEQESSILSRSDFKIFTATSGDEALNIHRAEQVDLIITDLEMPGMAGDVLTNKIRQDIELKKVSVIIICTRRQYDLDRCAKCGANSYLTRPLNPEELLERVNSLLNVPFRKDLRVLIRVTVKGNFRNEPFFCKSQDISRSGLLIETERALAKGDEITCSFYVPDDERIMADAVVVRIIKKETGVFLYGVNFSKIGLTEAHAIERYVLKKLGKS